MSNKEEIARLYFLLFFELLVVISNVRRENISKYIFSSLYMLSILSYFLELTFQNSLSISPSLFK